MKLSLNLLIIIVLTSNYLFAQTTDLQIGIKSEAKIELIDKELKIFKNRQNSNLKFKIINNSKDTIFVPTPTGICEMFPQFFELENDKVECNLVDCSLEVRPYKDFVPVNPNSFKIFELSSDFYINSCISFDKPSTAVLTYMPHLRLESFMREEYTTNEFIRIFPKLLYSGLKSEDIAIIYE